MTRHSTRIAALLAVVSITLTACGGGSGSGSSVVAEPISDGDPVAGAQVYLRACANCHGSDLAGVEGLGKALLPSAFIVENGEEEISTLILVGVPADDPTNMTGIDMSPNGGNPSLTSQDIADVSAYLKALQ